MFSISSIIFSGTTRRPLISSSKGNLGHLLGGSGSVEAVICVKAMVEKTIPQTLNLKVYIIREDGEVVAHLPTLSYTNLVILVENAHSLSN